MLNFSWITIETDLHNMRYVTLTLPYDTVPVSFVIVYPKPTRWTQNRRQTTNSPFFYAKVIIYQTVT